MWGILFHTFDTDNQLCDNEYADASWPWRYMNSCTENMRLCEIYEHLNDVSLAPSDYCDLHHNPDMSMVYHEGDSYAYVYTRPSWILLPTYKPDKNMVLHSLHLQ